MRRAIARNRAGLPFINLSQGFGGVPAAAIFIEGREELDTEIPSVAAVAVADCVYPRLVSCNRTEAENFWTLPSVFPSALFS